MAAAACLSVACQKEELVTFNPENVVAPVLHAVSDVEVTVDNKSTESLKFTWDAADFGVKTQVYYTLEMSANDVTVNLFSGVSGTSYAVSYDALNNKAFNDLGIESGVAGEVTFKLGAKLNVGEMYWATPVMATITPTSAEKVYPKLFVVGSYNGWAHDASNQFLFNFAEDDVTYQGVIDFGEDHSANEFKITGGGWGNDEHSAAGAQTEEASSVALVAGGGDNINAYKEKRYYHLTFNRSALSLSKSASFDQVGIIGLNGDWSNDIVMTFNPAKQRFYADVEVPEATEFKFRMDGGWDVNYGGDLKGLTPGGNNIAIEAGNYRIYFNMNNIKHVVVTSVTRDDLEDHGAAVWARTVEAIRRDNPDATIELLIPDMDARPELIDVVLASNPDIVGHNIETVERLTPEVRSRAKYRTSLQALKHIAESGAVAKSGLMVGLGETEEEILQTLRDLREVGVSIVTLGQYLRPTKEHYPVKAYITPEKFEEYRLAALEMGFSYCASAPLVRSSYLADAALEAVKKVCKK